MHSSSTGTFSFGTFTEAAFRFELSPFVIVFAFAFAFARFIGLMGARRPRLPRLPPEARRRTARIGAQRRRGRKARTGIERPGP
jgi:hypothetical protein